MKSTELTHIRYEKATDLGGGRKGEVTERYVIPTFVPQLNIKALDVTDLPEEERKQLQQLYAEYTEYYKQAVATLFTFEDWVSHTRGEDARPQTKWRTFKLENVEVLD